MFKKILAAIVVFTIIVGVFCTVPTRCATMDDAALIETIPEESTEIPLSEESPVLIDADIDETAPTEPEIDYDPLTLRRSFGYYKGSKPMGDITKIVFTDEHPETYDERWCANLSDTEEIVGYLIGTEVYIVGEKIYTNYSAGYMFAGCNSYDEPLWENLREIEGLDHLDTSRTRQFEKTFYGNQYLTEIDLNSWDMSSVSSVGMMFSMCTNLETVHIDEWDVSNIKYFTAMFQGSDWSGDMKLKNIDVSKWDTRSAISMGHMFYGCAQLETVDVSNWNVENVTTFTHMFADCNKLQSIDMTKWNTYSVISFDAMFNDCHSLTEIDVSGLETSTCTQYSQMFEACKNLTTIIGIEDLDVSSANYYAFSEMFHCCSSLTSLDLSNWDVSNADNMARMFAKCSNLKYLNISGWDIGNVKTVLEMFNGVYNITIDGIDELDFSNIKNYEQMY